MSCLRTTDGRRNVKIKPAFWKQNSQWMKQIKQTRRQSMMSAALHASLMSFLSLLCSTYSKMDPTQSDHQQTFILIQKIIFGEIGCIKTCQSLKTHFSSRTLRECVFWTSWSWYWWWVLGKLGPGQLGPWQLGSICLEAGDEACKYCVKIWARWNWPRLRGHWPWPRFSSGYRPSSPSLFLFSRNSKF